MWKWILLLSVPAALGQYVQQGGDVSPLGVLLFLGVGAWFLGGKVRVPTKLAKKPLKWGWKLGKALVYDKPALRRGRLWGIQWTLIATGIFLTLLNLANPLAWPLLLGYWMMVMILHRGRQRYEKRYASRFRLPGRHR